MTEPINVIRGDRGGATSRGGGESGFGGDFEESWRFFYYVTSSTNQSHARHGHKRAPHAQHAHASQLQLHTHLVLNGGKTLAGCRSLIVKGREKYTSGSIKKKKKTTHNFLDSYFDTFHRKQPRFRKGQRLTPPLPLPTPCGRG